MIVKVVATGPLALLVDRGRPGFAALGVPRSGAADRAAYELGARLVGNHPGAAAIEATAGGLAVASDADLPFALTGADAGALIDDRPAPFGGPGYLLTGQILRLGTPPRGLRTYLSVRGGFAAPLVLGSASRDVLSGLGPPPLAAGRLLAIGAAAAEPPSLDHAPQPEPGTGRVPLPYLPGPRDDWFAADALAEGTWRVSPASNRIGVRLSGPAVARRHGYADRELPSEPVVRGAIQVPPDGQPVVFGPDHPLTGGYPVLGVLTERACDALAQCPPGSSVRFVRLGGQRPIGPEPPQAVQLTTDYGGQLHS